MLHPTINELTKGQLNKYELALATAKCAREVTEQYVQQREEAERLTSGGKDADHPINTLIDKDLRDDKAVKTAIRRIYTGEYVIVKREQTEQVEAQAETDAE